MSLTKFWLFHRGGRLVRSAIPEEASKGLFDGIGEGLSHAFTACPNLTVSLFFAAVVGLGIAWLHFDGKSKEKKLKERGRRETEMLDFSKDVTRIILTEIQKASSQNIHVRIVQDDPVNPVRPADPSRSIEGPGGT